MMKLYIAIFCVILGVVVGGVAVYVGMQKSEVQHVPVTVTRQQWNCRTTVQESYIRFQPILVGKIVTMMPVTDWRDVSYQDASGEGLEYACPKATLIGNQREVFRPVFFVSFSDRVERVYEYRTEDYDIYKGFTPQAHWVLGLNRSGEVVGTRPAN